MVRYSICESMSIIFIGEWSAFYEKKTNLYAIGSLHPNQNCSNILCEKLERIIINVCQLS